MAQRSHVPQFGDWESEENIPYTAYFDKARKGKSGGKFINPNDPEENPDAFSDETRAVRASPLRSAPDVEAPPPASARASGPKHELHSSKEEAEFRRSTGSPARQDIRRPYADAPHNRGVALNDSHRRGGRISGGSDRSSEHSPLHPHHQAKTSGRGGVSSPSGDRKGAHDNSHGLASTTPGRSRLKPETPERGAVVPKFGEWDENDPASADGYTHVFNKVKEEKHTGAAKVPVVPAESSYANGSKYDSAAAESTSWCCFSWSKK